MIIHGSAGAATAESSRVSSCQVDLQAQVRTRMPRHGKQCQKHNRKFTPSEPPLRLADYSRQRCSGSERSRVSRRSSCLPLVRAAFTTRRVKQCQKHNLLFWAYAPPLRRSHMLVANEMVTATRSWRVIAQSHGLCCHNRVHVKSAVFRHASSSSTAIQYCA